MEVAECRQGCEFDVAVLGAGAAGLCAGIRAAECGARVIVLEKNRRRRREDSDIRQAPAAI